MEEGSIWLYTVSLAVLVALSAYFSASETAFSTVNRIRLKKLAKEGNKKASRALKIADRFDSAISTILIGNNIVNIAAASIGTLLFTGLMGPSGAGVSTLVMTVVVLIFGEVMPKSVANEYSESFAMFASGVLSALMKVFSPFVWCFAKLKKGLSKKLAGPMGEAANQPSVTEEELKVIIDEIQDEGVLEEQESDLVQSALEFDEICVNEVLTPRVDVVGVELGDSIESIRDLFFAERYSRCTRKTSTTSWASSTSRSSSCAWSRASAFRWPTSCSGPSMSPPPRRFRYCWANCSGRNCTWR